MATGTMLCVTVHLGSYSKLQKYSLDYFHLLCFHLIFFGFANEFLVISQKRL